MKTAIKITEPVNGLSDRELAAVLAGLRLLQGRVVDVHTCFRDIESIRTNGGTLKPLSPDEQACCEQEEIGVAP